MHVTSVVRLRIAPYAVPNGLMIDHWLNDNSCLTPFPRHSTLPLWWTIHRWQMSTLQRACVLGTVGSSRTTQTISQWYFQTLVYIPQEIFSTISSCSVNHSTYINMNIMDFSMECSSCSSTVLDGWSQHTYLKQHHWQSFQCIFLFNINRSTLSAIWWNIIWSLCDHVKCHIWK